VTEYPHKTAPNLENPPVDLGKLVEQHYRIDIVCKSYNIIMKHQPKQPVGRVNFTSLPGPVTLWSCTFCSDRLQLSKD